MLLSNLLKDYCPIAPEHDREISHLISDSRLITQNAAFLAFAGQHVQGHQYIQEAIARGASCVIYDAPTSHENLSFNFNGNIPIIPIYKLTHHIGLLAARFYHFPAQNMRLIGVTGTSGKTSCAHFIAQALQHLHIPCGLIGTLGCGQYGNLRETHFTTPDAISLQAILRQLHDQSLKTIAMEVSSHGIDQGRINTLAFELGIFTNLSQDHLDYHHTLSEYAAVKYKFFTDFPMQHAILNIDDEYGQSWAKALSQLSRSVVGFSLKKPVEVYSFPVIYADNIHLSSEGISALIHSPWGKGELFSPLMGSFNLSNLLAALTTLCLYGIEFDDVLASLSHILPVPGRMQILGGQGKPVVVVDYAHKPDALEKVLQTLRHHTKGKLICVFGCGGNRDSLKRPLMAAIAEKHADQVIITNDNPRHENPEDIVQDITKGFVHPERISIILDRSHAIQKSIQLAAAADCVLIAGKGAERYQQFGDEKHPFDDVSIAKHYLQL
jgi:UDP-N-acetylmuramoyl-L-alanyl-D-glutamate--2,6-diaminopimelate ligase